MAGKHGMNKSGAMGGKRPGSGRKPAPVGTFILDCTPTMADLVSGATHRPRKQRRGESAVAWARQTHAWPHIVAQLGWRRTSRPVIVCNRDDAPAGDYAERIAWVRQALGYDDALVLKCGLVLVAIQRDGVRAAVTDVG